MTPDQAPDSTPSDAALAARLRSAWPAQALADGGFTQAVMARVNAQVQARRAREQLSPQQARLWAQRSQTQAGHRARQTRQALVWGCMLGAAVGAAGSALGAWPVGAAWLPGLGGLIASAVLAWSVGNLEV